MVRLAVAKLLPIVNWMARVLSRHFEAYSELMVSIMNISDYGVQLVTDLQQQCPRLSFCKMDASGVSLFFDEN
jgi:hypothetical protein